jgi:hypothetical protein
MSSDRRHKRTMRVFSETYGDPPWDCFFCRQPVTCLGQGTWDGNVHHIDNDVANDTPDNIAPSHTVCHQRHHGVTDEMRQRISAKLKGRPSPTKGMKFSAEVNAKKGQSGPLNGMYGKSLPQHVRDAVSRANRRRTTCDRCNAVVALHWLQRHQANNCSPSKMIQIGEVFRIRGVEPKITCIECGKPYAQRWMQRHKDDGKCIEL